MELHFAPGAPSARKFRIMLREKGLLGAVIEKPFASDAGVQPPLKLTQLRGDAVIEPIEIIFALDTCGAGARLVPGDRSARAEALKLLVLADDALVCGVRLLADAEPADRWRNAISTSIAAAEQLAPKAEPLTIGGVAMAAALTWIDAEIPAIDWKARSPALSRLQSTLEARHSFQDVRVNGG